MCVCVCVEDRALLSAHKSFTKRSPWVGIHDSVSLLLSHTPAPGSALPGRAGSSRVLSGNVERAGCWSALGWSAEKGGNRWVKAAARPFIKLQSNPETQTCQTEMLFWESSARQALEEEEEEEERLLKSLVLTARRPDQTVYKYTHIQSVYLFTRARAVKHKIL